MNLQPAPIIVVNPDLDESNTIAGWLRDTGLGRISTARTCDEAIFLLGRSHAGLLIIDAAISRLAEERLLRHIRAASRGTTPPLIRLICQHAPNPAPSGSTTAAEIIRKPLIAHDVVLKIGNALHQPDLLGRFDRSRDQTAQHLDAAQHMQIGLLPMPDQLRTIGERCGVGVAALYRSGDAIGGDLWGIWPTGKGRFALAIADFAGHGLSAALNTFRMHALLSETTLPRSQPVRMTELLNERLHLLLSRGQYATMVYLHIDPARQRVTWCGAGGPAPLLVSADRTDHLEAQGLPLGVKPGTIYRQRWMRLPRAGMLAVFSDGLFESGGKGLDVPPAALSDALREPARLAAEGNLADAAEYGTVQLQALRDHYPCPGHSDDVMAICVAFGPVAADAAKH